MAVIIGMDPHKRPATIEVVDPNKRLEFSENRGLWDAAALSESLLGS